MVSATTGNALAFNGEIYNADGLRQMLERDGRQFLSGTDTEVVLAAYDRWGRGAFSRLRGMYACALWDRDQERLTLARDPLGIKPLYFSDREGTFAFASEIRAVIAGTAESAELSLTGLCGLLATGSVPEPGTIIDGIAALAPGTILSVSRGTRRSESFWSLDDAFSEPLAIERPDAVRLVRHELEAAVERQLVSDAPLGVFLSGGLDSSTLVGLAANAGHTIRTVSLVFAEEAMSEAPWIDAVRKRWNTDHYQLELSASEFRAELPAVLAAIDQPTVDGVNTYVVSRVARERAGLKVALSGTGGDELFAGYALFQETPRLLRMRRLVPRLSNRLARATARIAGGGSDRGRKLARWLARDALSAYALQRELIDPGMRSGLMGDVSAIDDEPGEGAEDANALSKLELTHYLRNTLLRDSDILSMAHGLELRVPMLDQQLVELVARIPAQHKTERGRQKPLLADAVEDLLPEAVRSRSKMGFTLPYESWLRTDLRREVRGRLLDPQFGGQVAEVVAQGAIVDLWNRFERGETSWSRPWAVYVAKVWGDRHL